MVVRNTVLEIIFVCLYIPFTIQKKMMTLFDGLFEKTNNSYNIKTGLSLINNNVLAELSEVD